VENPIVEVWSREQIAPREAMSQRRVVEMALHIADAEGLETLSMRRLAADLRSGTTSLYRYVSSRDELIDLMLDAAYGAEPFPELTGDWRTDLAAMARRLRTAALRRPWTVGAMTTRPALGPNALRQMDASLAAAASLTSDSTAASNVVTAIGRYTLGTVAAELAEVEARRRTGLTQEQWRATVAPYIRQVIAGGAYPHFARRVIEADDLDAAAEFEFGLACLLDGIAARVAAGRTVT
jgi:AcrR family transcriptional regulator